MDGESKPARRAPAIALAALLAAADIAAYRFVPAYRDYAVRLLAAMAAAYLLSISKVVSPAAMGIDVDDWRAELAWTAKAAGALALAGLACLLIAALAIERRWVPFDASLLAPTDITSLDRAGKYLLHSCVMAPVMEELVYRGILLGPWRRGDGAIRIPPLLLSAAYFLAIHFVYFGALPPIACAEYVVAGIILGFAFLKRGALVPCILLHAIGNLCVALKDLSLIEHPGFWRWLLGA